MGTSPEDFVHAAREAKCFVGLPESHGGSGDTSVPTALGVLQGMKATATVLWDSESLAGRTVAVQGVGKVGSRLVRLLVEEGARCLIADVDGRRVDALREEFPESVEAVDVATIHAVSCDIFAPCAGGGVINDKTIEELKCRAVVGSANNQLEDDRHGDRLHELGILYAPDYLVNAGGLIQVADELSGYNEERVMAKTRSIYGMLLKIYRLSREQNIPTYRAEDRLVANRMEQVADLRRIFLGL